MRTILFVIPGLEYGGAAGQLVHLLEALPGEQFRRHVCVLGRAGPWADRLRRAGVAVDVPGRGRLFDLKPWAHLRGLVRSLRPDVVHAWGLPALWATAVSGFRGRRVASPFLGPGLQPGLGRLDAWLLRRADNVIVFGATEAGRCDRLGVEARKVVRVDPGVRPSFVHAAAAAAAVPGVPAGARVILGIGPLEVPKGFREALWALDMLRYVHPDLRLVLAGAGSARRRLERFAVALEATPAVHFTGPVEDVAPLLARADVVWSPGRVESGALAVLEAMAAGRPVVAARWPRLAELVDDGVTGFLVPPNDPLSLARQTQRLLTDPALLRQTGEAARRRAADHFHADLLARRCAAVYLD